MTTSGLNRQAEERDEHGELRLTPLYCKENFALLEVQKSGKSFASGDKLAKYDL